jgi:hypothetical protein
MVVPIYENTWHHNPEDYNLSIHCNENSRSQKQLYIYIITVANSIKINKHHIIIELQYFYISLKFIPFVSYHIRKVL